MLTLMNPRLQTRLLKNGVQFIKRAYSHIDHVFDDFPDAAAVFNCTGLGARNLGGVEDKDVYPAKVRIPTPSSHLPILMDKTIPYITTPNLIKTGSNNLNRRAQNSHSENVYLGHFEIRE